ncbi:hypothetical protein Bxe_A1398 [Paraburkholderia xenovorans LB400]|uniref:Uncharacterized protein n=1 Tax=Paraburkholderia xenovorans (strain LB400) TaxID=266265 RepID=Q13WI3_PARXL|nr:hypothetical protein Bxe_A1398 [Paraburkholderia xenovorans LB400]
MPYVADTSIAWFSHAPLRGEWQWTSCAGKLHCSMQSYSSGCLPNGIRQNPTWPVGKHASAEAHSFFHWSRAHAPRVSIRSACRHLLE